MTGRIRSVKPSWIEDQKMASSPLEARVLSVALILLADDYGNGRAYRNQLAGQVFPENLAKAPETLARAFEALEGWFVELYSVDGQDYFHICNWEKHQRVDHPGKPAVPGPNHALAKSSRESREKLGVSRASRDPIPSLDPSLSSLSDPDQPDRSDQGAVSEVRLRTAEPVTAKPKRRPARALTDVTAWLGPNDTHRAIAAESGCDVDLEAERLRDWALGKDEKKADWDAAFRNWLRKPHNGSTALARAQPLSVTDQRMRRVFQLEEAERAASR